MLSGWGTLAIGSHARWAPTLVSDLSSSARLAWEQGRGLEGRVSGHELSSGLENQLCCFRQILSLPRMTFVEFLGDAKGGTGQLPISVSPISSHLKRKHNYL